MYIESYLYTSHNLYIWSLEETISEASPHVGNVRPQNLIGGRSSTKQGHSGEASVHLLTVIPYYRPGHAALGLGAVSDVPGAGA